MTDTSIPPLKCCTRCKRELPATTENFAPHKKTRDRLDSWCRPCHKEYSLQRNLAAKHCGPHLEIIPGMKRCFACGVYLPANSEHFHRTNDKKDGLTGRCKACTKVHSRQRYEAHKDKVQRTILNWNRSHPDKVRTASIKWREAHPEKVREASQRRAARKNNLPATLTEGQWKACLEYFHNCCAYCGAQQSLWHTIEKEHFRPLTSGGGYTVDNIIPACKSCNSSKCDLDPREWINSRFKPAIAKRRLAKIEAYFAWVKAQSSESAE